MQRQQSFWDFSVRTYGKSGVGEACLSLQEKYGVDVNVLLYCCWHGCTRGTLDERAMERVLSFAQRWAHHVVRPLRAARTWMKATGCTEAHVGGKDCRVLREEIKRAELKAERLQEDTMQELTRAAALHNYELTSQIHSTLLNISSYHRHMEIKLDEDSSAELAHIVTAAISGTSLDSVTNALNTTFQES